MVPIDPNTDDLTGLLRACRDGGDEARNLLFARVYDEMRSLARGPGLKLPEGATLTPTDLANEAFLRLVHSRKWADLADRRYFWGAAAKSMCDVLVDYKRKREAEKRGGNRDREPLDDVVGAIEANGLDLLDLKEAIEALQARDPRAAEVIRLKFFAGRSMVEIAEMMEVHVSTVEADDRFARAWLRRRLGGRS